MPTATFSKGAKIAGYDLSLDVPVYSDAQTAFVPEVPLAHAATDWTYGSESTGTAVLETGHGLLTGDTVDLYFADGYRYGMRAAVSGNSVALSGGEGDNCPASDTAVIVAQQADVTMAFTNDSIKGIMAIASVRSLFCLIDNEGTVYDYELVPVGDATEDPSCLEWSLADAGDCPWSGKAIVSATASSANTTAPVPPALNVPIVVCLGFDSTVGSGS